MVLETGFRGAEIYYAAWAIVLARHSDDLDLSDVSFGCVIGASQELKRLHLVFSLGTAISSFLDAVREELEELTSSSPISDESLIGFQPFASTLQVGDKVTLSDAALEVAVNITCPADGQNGAIKAHQQHSIASSAGIEILIAHLEEAVLQLRTLPPSTSLHDIDLFTAVDSYYLLRWNRDPPSKVDETLVSLFAHQVRLQPEAPAVCSWDRNLSYAKLDEISAKLACEFVRRGVKPEDAVALCCDKSALAIVAMMAVLRVGANFVNIGISTPPQRQAHILDACKATLLVVDASNSACLAEHRSLPGFQIDFSSAAALSAPTAPLPKVFPSYVAAIVFTSGSTGLPKGILVEHGSITTSCEAMSNRFDIGPHSRILQFASYTFDASVGDIFYGLSRGACVCSPSEEERVNNLAATARRMQVNWAFLTPSVLSLLVPSDIPSLRRMLHGGEPPSPKHVSLWAESVSVHLVMGPAECAIYCAGSEAVVPGQDTSIFGRATGCRMWVVDAQDHTKLVPLGCSGELVVEGRIVTRGYLNDDNRTRQAFLDDAPWLPPQSKAAPSTRRLYKSGDLVRFDVDKGNFSFLARKDTQVKLHGQRVELGEIEHHLKEVVPNVNDTAAMLNESAERANRHPLVAFLVFAKVSTAVQRSEAFTFSLTPQGTEVLHSVRGRLKTILPPYMIPTLFIPIRQIPFTLNGKRDTTKLRQIVESLSEQQLHIFSLSHDVVAKPMNIQEEQLRDLWAQVLNIRTSKLTPDSDFIQEGGDSLGAMRLSTSATKAGFHLPVATILRCTPLSDMAAELTVSTAQEQTHEPYSLLPNTVDVAGLKDHCASICRIDANQIEDIFPSTPPQGMLMAAALANPGTYVLRMTFQLPASLQLQKFMSAWTQVVESADIMRTRLVSDSDAGLLQVVLKSFEWDFYKSVQEYEHQNHHTSMTYGSRLARLAIIHNESAQIPIFAFTAHHVLYDGFMLNMLFDRVTEIYQTGHSHSFSSFKNYVAYLQHLPIPASLSFWKNFLASCPAPTWPPPRNANHLDVAHIRQHIPVPTRPREFTPAVIAQAAFTLCASAQTGTDDITFCMSFSGRDAPIPSILNCPGPTLFTIPFRTKIKRQGTLYALYDNIRRNITDFARHGFIGLRTIMAASPDAANACNFRTLFAVQPRHVDPPASVFGQRLSFKEDMGRLPLLFECWIVEDGVDLVVEFNTSSLGMEEMRDFVDRFVSVLTRMVEAPFDTPLAEILIDENTKEDAYGAAT